MKSSVSVANEDVEFLDAYAREQGFRSRTAVVHIAVRLLQATELSGDYAEARDQWSESGDADAWDATGSDGLDS